VSAVEWAPALDALALRAYGALVYGTADEDPDTLEDVQRAVNEAAAAHLAAGSNVTTCDIKRMVALDFLGEILEVLRPQVETRLAVATKITVLGEHLADAAFTCDCAATDIPGDDADLAAWELAGAKLEAAGDLIDEAIRALAPQDDGA